MSRVTTGRQRVEAVLARAAMGLLGALPATVAARLGGGIARVVGPLLPVSEVARINLRLALPERGETAHRRIVRGIWWNLGCTVGEMPHLAEFRLGGAAPGYQIEGAEIVRGLAAKGGPAIFFSGHIGNWELLTPAAAQLGMRLALFYRAAENPAVDEMISNFRRFSAGGDLTLLPKGASGAREALAHLRAGGFLAILADQKMNDGIEVKLFGQPAMTAPALAALALRFRCPVVPVHVERLGPAQLSVTVEPPLPLPASGDRVHDIALLTLAVNSCLEGWIRARPEEWLWLHRRFGKENYGRRGRRG
ncbi:MAG: lysophospholipid acyltransferase family protein [Acetobacteraceae bacterium]